MTAPNDEEAALDIATDIRAARPPSLWFYRSEEVLRWTAERIFARSWLGLLAAPPESDGAWRPHVLLPGFLDEPIVLSRDAGGRLWALANVCTHRGHPVVLEDGSGSRMVCRYHGRAFAPDGACVAMRGFEGVEGFPGPEDALPAAHLAALGPIPFVSIDPSAVFSDWVAPVRAYLDRLPFAAARPDAAHDRSWSVGAHWALYVENFLEGLHVPYVHPGLTESLDLDAYPIELFASGSLQVGLARTEGDAIPGIDHAGHPVAALWFWLFPSTMLNVYPWGVSLNVVEPVAAQQTVVRFRRFVWDPERAGRGAGADLDRVEREDERVVEAVQRNTASRLHRGGRYAPEGDRAVHHFHRLLARALAT